ncbi:putative ABC transporter permease [Clostridium sp. 'White wine YQ']|uniref:putative ABC transporter permease n=1 Tax=Clostridium sp. 'White wine YQ' TaxID=3027474 RepID=UPI002366BADA|nr:putative ABC transporter permease [Clostridium sp. 'White wine YQ']MDD7793252.1 putative ABC transporter permease [Clostridium sp. 'White wine YQ']
MITIYHSILGVNLYEIVLLFFIYSLLGWVTEVIYQFYNKRYFVNRGFLYGPLCPIYGTGIVSVVLLFNNFKSNILLLYVLSTVIISFIEYITGFILEKFFKSKWWDYTNEPFNLHGRICLSFSLVWGIAALVIIKFINPLISNIVSSFPKEFNIMISYILLLVFTLDVAFTLSSLVRFSKMLTRLQLISSELKERYEYIIVTTKDAAFDAVQNIENNIKELRHKYDTSFDALDFNHKRLLRAFPNLKPSKFDNILKEIKEKLNSLKEI